MLVSPPGLPGGGITGIFAVPASGAGARISGSTPGGGHSTPSERASLSPSASPLRPVVVMPFGPDADGAVGVQFADPDVAGDCAVADAICNKTKQAVAAAVMRIMPDNL